MGNSPTVWIRSSVLSGIFLYKLLSKHDIDPAMYKSRQSTVKGWRYAGRRIK